jgi:WD40 repeat protein/serine/threonine protein kinase
MPHPCSQTADLETLLGECLSVDELNLLTAHLDKCATCQARLEELMAATPEWTNVFRLAEHASAQPDSALQRIMDRMKDLSNLQRAVADDKQLLGFLDPPAKPGQVGCLGQYAITEVIGRGGTGVVFKAIDPALDRVVAMKVLAPHLAASAAARRRFAREAKAAAAVCHDNVMAIYAVDEANGLPFLIMQYVAGLSLQERLDRTGPLQIREILRIGVQTAAGLAAAHAQGLVHRDIKPANILLENGVERVRITDFGLARAADDASLTQSGVLAGTPQYMAPEQARGDSVDHRADLFSLGSVLYALSTGRPPFRASTMMGVLRRVSDGTPRSILEINPDVPAWLVATIAKLHAKDPAERFQTAAELSQLLAQYLAHVEQPARVPLPANPLRSFKPSAVGQAAGSLWRGVLAFVVLLGLGLAITLGLTGATVAWRQFDRIFNSDTPETMDMEALGVSPSLVSLRTSLPHKSGAVYTAGFAPGGELLATGSHDGTVKLWDLSSRQKRATLQGHKRTVWSVAFAGNGRMLASGAGDWHAANQPGEIKVWDATTGDELFSLEGHRGIVFSVAFSPDSRFLVSGSADQTVRVWDLAARRELRQLKGHTGPVRSVTFSHDGQTLASGSFDGTIRLWEVPTGLLKGTLLGHGGRVNCVVFSPDDRTLAVGEFGCRPDNGDLSNTPGLVTLWDLAAGKERGVLEGHRAQLLSLAFSPDGLTLATGGGDWKSFGEVKLWDVATGQELVELHGHTEWVECVAFSPDGRTLVSAGGTAGSGGEVKLWNVARKGGP